MIVLGFDYGSKKIGVASGQDLTGQAAPLITLPMVQQRPDWERIQRLIDEWQPHRLIVGLPLNMDDTPTALTERVKRFARQLQGRYRLPVELVDERLTSKIARADYGNAVDRAGLDAFAAKLILETWLSQYEHPYPH